LSDADSRMRTGQIADVPDRVHPWPLDVFRPPAGDLRRASIVAENGPKLTLFRLKRSAASQNRAFL
jgi:hypothetical protein